MVLLLGGILFLIFIYSSSFFVAQKKDYFQDICLRDLVELQKNTVRKEKNLFSLNPISTLLRTQINLSKQRLLAATASGNGPGIAAETAVLNELRLKQKSLDLFQKKLISQNKIMLNISILKIKNKINYNEMREKLAWNEVISYKSDLKLSNQTQIAIKADSIGGLAPNYELTENYKTLQMLVLKMQFKYRTKLSSKYYSYNKKCEISFYQKGEKWEIIVNQE